MIKRRLTDYELDQQIAKAKRFPMKRISIGRQGWLVYHKDAGILFQLYRPHRAPWQLKNYETGELITDNPYRDLLGNIIRNWMKGGY